MLKYAPRQRANNSFKAKLLVSYAIPLVALSAYRCQKRWQIWDDFGGNSMLFRYRL